ncbi:ATP-binding protein [Clostridium culturomicium]|uniref:ATP-binding protein n=1 Tax=Clostridium culturomicium TaxID=1499683 RepID=UPI00058BD724|nr:4Fe-4S dicluster domain-containing protein [Clostridium culturomicium]
MKRNIIKIHEEKCNGCGICVTACHERAIELVNGKAKLISDIYCDGLGDCLPNCPTDAIEMIQREAEEYDDDAVQARIKQLEQDEKVTGKEVAEKLPCGCPGTVAKVIERPKQSVLNLTVGGKATVKETVSMKNTSELRQWPIQIALVNTVASYLKGADLLIAADCTAYAYGSFHQDFMKDKITLIGCPKLDDNKFYEEKLVEILSKNEIKSITVVRMEVPCCSGIVGAVKGAMLKCGIIVNYKEVTISTGGQII